MDTARLNAALATGDWTTAQRLLAPLAGAAGAHPSLVYNYGKVLLEQGRAAEAMAVLRRLVDALPDHAHGWFELGRAALAADALPQALAAFARALELAPGDRDARRNLGRVALRCGAFAVAHETWMPLAGDAEADLALYRAAAELRLPEAAARRDSLLRDHPDRASVLRTLVRVSKGAFPLDLMRRG